MGWCETMSRDVASAAVLFDRRPTESPMRSGFLKAVGRAAFLLVAAGVFLSGCSGTPPMVSAKGVVRLNGKPAESCQVVFFPEEEDVNPLEHGYGVAYTNAAGEYEIKNALGDVGIFPGRYKVTLIQFVDKAGKVLPPTAKPSEVPGGTFNQMPQDCMDPRTTPHTAEVPRAGLTKDFDITHKPAK
jgi:hypothetical protein